MSVNNAKVQFPFPNFPIVSEQDEGNAPQCSTSDSEYQPLLPRSPGRSSILIIVSTFLLGVFVANADTSIALATYGLISSDFGDLTGPGWIITSYMIAGCATQALYGKLSDIFSRKSTLLFAYSIFTIGLIICGASTELWHFVLGRIISGCGGSGMTVLVTIIISDLVPISEVALWRSYVNMAAMLGRSVGGPIGGLLADLIGWRWTFFIQCPLAVLAFVMVSWLYKTTRIETENMRQKLCRIDFFGSMTMTMTIVLFLVGLEAFKNGSWQNFVILLAVALLSGLCFYKIERKVKEPVFPPTLLAQRAVITSYLTGACQFAGQFGAIFSVPMYFQLTQNASTSRAGLQILPAVAGNALGGILCGIFIRKTGRYKSITIIAAISSMLSYTLLLLRWQGHTNMWESLYIMPGGFGTGIALSSSFIALSVGVKQSDIATAASGLYMSITLGGILGLSSVTVVLRTVLSSALQTALIEMPNKQEIITESMASLEYVKNLQSPVRELVLAAYVKGLGATHLISLCWAACALLAAVSMRQVQITSSAATTSTSSL